MHFLFHLFTSSWFSQFGRRSGQRVFKGKKNSRPNKWGEMRSLIEIEERTKRWKNYEKVLCIQDLMQCHVCFCKSGLMLILWCNNNDVILVCIAHIISYFIESEGNIASDFLAVTCYCEIWSHCIVTNHKLIANNLYPGAREWPVHNTICIVQLHMDIVCEIPL